MSLVWPALLLALLTFGVFSPILRNDFAGIWDDDIYIAHNPDYNPPTLKKLAHYWVPPPKEEFFVPVLYTTWGLIAMEARSVSPNGVVTFNAMAFHALSIAAHIGSVVFTFLILVRLSRSRAAAFLGASIFALHPVQVEAVAWASTAYTPLCAMFCLVAIWQFFAATDADETMRTRKFAVHYAIASFAFLVAMLTKPAALSAPLIIAAIEIALRKRPIRKLILPLGAWVFVAVVIVSITRNAVPAGTVGYYPPLQRVVIALDAIAFYLYRVVWPLNLCIDYGRSPKWVLGDPSGWLLYVIPTAHWLMLVIPIVLFTAARLLRQRVPSLNSAFGVFLAALLPTLGLAPFTFQSFSTVADRYAYLALFALAMLVTFGVRKIPTVLTTIITLCVATILSALTIRHIPQWRNEWTLFDATLKTNPDSHIVAGDLQYMLTPAEQAKCTLSASELEAMGDRLMLQKRSKLASDVYEMSVDRDAVSRAYVKLARARLQTQQPTSALEAARTAARLAPDDPAAKSMLDEAQQAAAASH
jgi:hypothetical protein